MTDFLKNQRNFAKIEFWAFTTLFVFVIFFFVTNALDGGSAMNEAPYKKDFEKANVPYSYFGNYFIPQLTQNIVLFLTFLVLNFILIPKLVKRQAVLKNLLFLALLYILVGTIFGIANTYLHGYRYAGGKTDQVEQEIFLDGFVNALAIFVAIGLYNAIKYAGLYLLSKSEKLQSRFGLPKETIVATIIWFAALLIFWIFGADFEFQLFWAVLILYGIAFYAFSFQKLIPASLRKKRPLVTYFWRSALVMFLTFFPLLGILMAVTHNEDLAFTVLGFNIMFQVFIAVPVTWLLYKRQQKGNEEVTVLKKELTQSTANMDFLRSQVNPHFLFNVLNTLYGTAIQENAERTSEGIQRLGDMMRFMLHENTQEKISLNREIDYLQNYIGLQQLRTDKSPDIQIQTIIDTRETVYQIAPMLLIPFVENAFKHGISFREPSHIKIILEIKDRTLYLDVYNSKHLRQHTDPEKDKSGIGLDNVKQRLKLVYPKKHELMIRDTTNEFFVHLSIDLS